MSKPTYQVLCPQFNAILINVFMVDQGYCLKCVLMTITHGRASLTPPLGAQVKLQGTSTSQGHMFRSPYFTWLSDDTLLLTMAKMKRNCDSKHPCLTPVLISKFFVS